ncbi:19e65444-75cf-476d-90f0-2e75eb43adbd-CDS [Sclerotinia trifoliorum]|uniref:19e65444-75cf-476d-90f0-2e75eb43adbd-CDS n=1 Tax=Sclerotinia trifoliorum TaxID=28548 RepID=A0A8H2VNF9_9HELO|nr:19e65444-75cf-476d-90f0-2e75eb43adbd-CDS [Sclerotinia trifoliorum]
MIDTVRTSKMADFDFPGIDLSDPFLPPSGSISIYSPFKYNTPKPAVKPTHDYGTFTYPLTPEDEQPRPLSLPLRPRDFSLNSTPSLSFSRSSSTSSRASFSSSTFDIPSNRLSNTKWKPLTSFPYFTSLPLEIQRTIWRRTLPGAQIIEIHQYAPSTARSSSYIQVTKQQAQEPLPILKTHAPVPIALHINHLSRHLALSHLSPLSFAQPYYLPSNPYAYINYIHDTIYLSTRTLYPDLGKHILYSRNLQMIRYLALEFRVWTTLLGDNHFVNALLEMEGLLRIDIIFERDLSLNSFESSSSSNNFSNNDASSITSKPPEESTDETNPQTTFLEPTKQEQRDIEEIFSKESEKTWLWGRISGWEDVREKLRFKFKVKQSDKVKTQNRNTKSQRWFEF